MRVWKHKEANRKKIHLKYKKLYISKFKGNYKRDKGSCRMLENKFNNTKLNKMSE